MTSQVKKARRGTTHIAIVLDKSGSMIIARDETVQAVNQQIESIKEHAKGTRVSMILFNQETSKPLIGQPASKIKPIKLDDYKPQGMTALYDGVAEAIYVLESCDPAEAYLVVIISDGKENASRYMARDELAEKIQALTDKGNWTFSYIGAVKDLDKVSRELSIPVGNIAYMDVSTVSGRVTGFNETRAATNSYMTSRAGGQCAMNNFYAEGDKSTDEG